MLFQRRFSIRSALTPAEACARLAAATAPAPGTRLGRDPRPFVGTLEGPAFRIIRTSRGRNSVRPLVRGRIEPDGGGSRLEGTTGLHPVVAVLLGILLVIPGGLVFGVMTGGTAADRRDPVLLVIPGVILLFVLVMGLAFLAERRRTLADLTGLVNRRPGSAT